MVDESAKTRPEVGRLKFSVDLIALILLVCVFTAGAILVFGRESSKNERSMSPLEKEAEKIFSRIKRLLKPAVMFKLNPPYSKMVPGTILEFFSSGYPEVEVYGDFDGDSSTGGFSFGSQKGLEKTVICKETSVSNSLVAKLYLKPRAAPKNRVISKYLASEAYSFIARVNRTDSHSTSQLLKRTIVAKKASVSVQIIVVKNGKKRNFTRHFYMQ